MLHSNPLLVTFTALCSAGGMYPRLGSAGTGPASALACQNGQLPQQRALNCLPELPGSYKTVQNQESKVSSTVVQEENFNIISQALSQEFLCFSYYERILSETLGSSDSSQAFIDEAQCLQLAALKQKVSIRKNFGTGAAALGNWEKVWRNVCVSIWHIWRCHAACVLLHSAECYSVLISQ